MGVQKPYKPFLQGSGDLLPSGQSGKGTTALVFAACALLSLFLVVGATALTHWYVANNANLGHGMKHGKAMNRIGLFNSVFCSTPWKDPERCFTQHRATSLTKTPRYLIYCRLLAVGTCLLVPAVGMACLCVLYADNGSAVWQRAIKVMTIASLAPAVTMLALATVFLISVESGDLSLARGWYGKYGISFILTWTAIVPSIFATYALLRYSLARDALAAEHEAAAYSRLPTRRHI